MSASKLSAEPGIYLSTQDRLHELFASELDAIIAVFPNANLVRRLCKQSQDGKFSVELVFACHASSDPCDLVLDILGKFSVDFRFVKDVSYLVELPESTFRPKQPYVAYTVKVTNELQDSFDLSWNCISASRYEALIPKAIVDIPEVLELLNDSHGPLTCKAIRKNGCCEILNSGNNFPYVFSSSFVDDTATSEAVNELIAKCRDYAADYPASVIQVKAGIKWKTVGRVEKSVLLLRSMGPSQILELALHLTLNRVDFFFPRRLAPHAVQMRERAPQEKWKPGEGPKQNPPGRLADSRSQHPGKNTPPQFHRQEQYAMQVSAVGRSRWRYLTYQGSGRWSSRCKVPGKLPPQPVRRKAGAPLQIGLLFLISSVYPVLHLFVFFIMLKFPYLLPCRKVLSAFLAWIWVLPPTLMLMPVYNTLRCRVEGFLLFTVCRYRLDGRISNPTVSQPLKSPALISGLGLNSVGQARRKSYPLTRKELLTGTCNFMFHKTLKPPFQEKWTWMGRSFRLSMLVPMLLHILIPRVPPWREYARTLEEHCKFCTSSEERSFQLHCTCWEQFSFNPKIQLAARDQY